MDSLLKQFAQSSQLGANGAYIEDLYEQYLVAPDSVDPEWKQYFDGLKGREAGDIPHSAIIDQIAEAGRQAARGLVGAAIGSGDERERHVGRLITAYRSRGHLGAKLDPLGLTPPLNPPDLELAFHHLSERDLDAEFSTGGVGGQARMKLRDLLARLRATYTGSIGAEFMHITDADQRRWLYERLEAAAGDYGRSQDDKRRILERLTAAEGLERYLHTKYVGQKRFSLEGGESLIPLLDVTIRRAGQNGVKDIVIGMAHRGRLNVLVNTLGKMPSDLFAEFEGKHVDDLPAGDVKYHKGFSSDVSTGGGPVHLSLAFNPSHLEIVNPVVEGSVRARQDRRSDERGDQVLPVLVHGDAAFAGQGVVMETLNLAQTRGYGTGGTLHIVINNQIGFTTSDPRDTRSTLYCTDVVKMIEAPVFHVNGDDPEAVVFVTKLALDYRQQFGHDVVVDIVCFRKLGHNEQDTPSLTQPLMYKSIGVHPGTRKLYADRLVAQGALVEGEPDQMVKDYRQLMEDGQRTVEPVLTDYKNKYATDWSPFLGAKWTDHADTGVPLAELTRIGEKLTQVPDGFTVHPLVNKLLADRLAMARGEHPVDWGMGEHLAFATLVANGYAIRITGQDSGRGTFTHRHAVLHDQKRERWDDGTYVPLQNVSESQAPFTVIDSVLSEAAVLGFEYGYATAEPNVLTIWEAQFGDFANGAQVVIDQFIASGEAKWGRACGLVLMLPHGYEGQGPEHSSARIERFLQLCADNNMQVVQPTNGAQIFHVLRRQMIRPFRKPLVIMTPKSLLRNKAATSALDDLATGTFQPVIGETNADIVPADVKRVLVCSGKVYYDLVHAREEQGRKDVAILRIEQLYPFAHKSFQAELQKYDNVTELVWVQDEPQNQGPWFYVQHHLYENMNDGQKLGYAGRPASASPAVGYMAKHQEQQRALIEQAFAPKLKSFSLIK